MVNVLFGMVIVALLFAEGVQLIFNSETDLRQKALGTLFVSSPLLFVIGLIHFQLV